MNMKNSLMLILIPFLSLLFNALSAKSSEEPLAPALYVLGDSLTDSGNNNGLPTQAKANYMPYGIDFNGEVSGRFTNGNTMADFIAQLLGLPLAPPYLGLSETERSQIITGLNYASGSAGILPETGSRLGKNIPIGEQIDYFQRTVEMDLPRNFNGPQALFNHLSKSIFIVTVGSNDYINNYLQPDYYNSSKYFSPQRFAGLLVDELSQQLTVKMVETMNISLNLKSYDPSSLVSLGHVDNPINNLKCPVAIMHSSWNMEQNHMDHG